MPFILAVDFMKMLILLEECEKNNIILLVQSQELLKLWEVNLAAKEGCKQHNIPMVPGFDELHTDVEKQS
jgi:hypothetical protein